MKTAEESTLARCWYCKSEIVLYGTETWCMAVWQGRNNNGEGPFVNWGTAQCEARDNHPRVHDPMPRKLDFDALNAWLDEPTIEPPSDR